MSKILNDKQYEIIGKAMHDYFANRVNTRLSFANSNFNDIDAVARIILGYMDYYNLSSNNQQ